MASIGEDYDIIGKMLENNGVYTEDPQAFELSSYLNQWRGTTFHITMNLRDRLALYTSPFYQNIVTPWTRAEGLTSVGRRIVQAYRETKQ